MRVFLLCLTFWLYFAASSDDHQNQTYSGEHFFLDYVVCKTKIFVSIDSIIDLLEDDINIAQYTRLRKKYLKKFQKFAENNKKNLKTTMFQTKKKQTGRMVNIAYVSLNFLENYIEGNTNFLFFKTFLNDSFKNFREKIFPSSPTRIRRQVSVEKKAEELAVMIKKTFGGNYHIFFSFL